MAGEVRKLREEDAPVVKVIATGVGVTVGLADDRQITFQTGFEGDEPDDAVNARLDRVMMFADRLKAKYELPKLEDELDMHRESLRRFEENLAEIEKRYEVEQAQRQVKIDTITRDSQANWSKNKAGPWHAQGATKRDLDLLSEGMLKAENERAQELKNAQTSRDRFLEETAKREAKIAKLKALLEG